MPDLLRICLVVMIISVAQFATAGIIIGGGDAYPTAPANTHLDLALKHLQAGDLDQAETELRGYLVEDPEHIDTKMWLAEVLFRKDELDDARQQIVEVIELRPDFAPAHQALGRYHYLGQDFEASEIEIKRAIELDPAMFAARVDLADLYLMIRNDPQKAAAEYRAAIEINPDHAGAHYGLGVSLDRAGDTSGAERAWRAASEIEPNNPLPMFALGNMLLTEGKVDQAFDAFTAALRADRRHLPSMMARGRIYAVRGEYGRALEEFGSVTALNENYAPAFLNVGLLRQREGEDEMAIEAYRKTLKLDDDQPLAHNNLAWLLSDHAPDLAEALSHARRATELEPRFGPYWDTLGWVQHRSGYNEQALESLTKALALQQDQASAYRHLAEVHSALGNIEAATEARRRAEELAEK